MYEVDRACFPQGRRASVGIPVAASIARHSRRGDLLIAPTGARRAPLQGQAGGATPPLRMASNARRYGLPGILTVPCFYFLFPVVASNARRYETAGARRAPLQGQAGGATPPPTDGEQCSPLRSPGHSDCSLFLFPVPCRGEQCSPLRNRGRSGDRPYDRRAAQRRPYGWRAMLTPTTGRAAHRRPPLHNAHIVCLGVAENEG